MSLSPVVFDVDGRSYRMSVPAIVMFWVHLRENRHWVMLCGCDGCGVVCFSGFPCDCEGHRNKRKRYDGGYANHRNIAPIPDVVARLDQLKRRSA